jgi:hypothetical protein
VSAEVDKQFEPCPFVYAKGKKCIGYIVRIEAFKADLAWQDRSHSSLLSLRFPQ